MVKLQPFTEQADAECRESLKRDPELSSSCRMNPDVQRGVRRRVPENLTGCCPIVL